jgi:hypothetical protein
LHVGSLAYLLTLDHGQTLNCTKRLKSIKQRVLSDELTSFVPPGTQVNSCSAWHKGNILVGRPILAGAGFPAGFK